MHKAVVKVSNLQAWLTFFIFSYFIIITCASLWNWIIDFSVNIQVQFIVCKFWLENMNIDMTYPESKRLMINLFADEKRR
jgi:dolichyl-phosphate-mannose--protein O-mannosyl transferase